jgi:hypothetical protein
MTMRAFNNEFSALGVQISDVKQGRNEMIAASSLTGMLGCIRKT